MNFLPCFTGPSKITFLTLASAWVMATGPRTVTNLIRTAGPAARKSHDAYQYFFSGAGWSVDALWEILFKTIIAVLAPTGIIRLAGDDTLLHHNGRRIFGVGVFRDAVRSSRKQVAYACGHNWVLLCVVVRVPLLTETYISLPVLARLRPKAAKKARRGPKGPTTVDLLAEMVKTVVSWTPGRRFELTADGAFASLAGCLPENVALISRLRKDAALFGPRPKPTGRAGRPRKKGARLPTPAQIASSPKTPWRRCRLVLYGEEVERLLHCFKAVWYEVCPDREILVVCVRDPLGNREDEFFFTTDLTLTAAAIVTGYSSRWSVEVAIRESKQTMGIEGPQARVEKAVLRQAPFAFLLLSLVKLWYLTTGFRLSREHGQLDPWYEHKEGVSYAEMLAVLRRASWRHWISAQSALAPRQHEILRPLIWCASRAA